MRLHRSPQPRSKLPPQLTLTLRLMFLKIRMLVVIHAPPTVVTDYDPPVAEDQLQVVGDVQIHAPPTAVADYDSPDAEDEDVGDGPNPPNISTFTLADVPERKEVSPKTMEEERIYVDVLPDEGEVLHIRKGPGKSKGNGKGKGKAKTKATPKKDWSLDAALEDDVLDRLKSNTYLWMRSKKGYKQKRAAWEMKAQELGVDVNHLEQWWRGIKDLYVKLSRKTSGQATRTLTERENWVIQHCGFYKGSIPSDTESPLVPLARIPSATVSSTLSRPLSPSGDSDISQSQTLEDIEITDVNQASVSNSTSTRSGKRGKRKREEECQEEDNWMRDLRNTMKANQALLEKLMDERPQSDREPFVRYVSDTLRTVPQEQYDVMKELIFYVLRQGSRCQSLSQQYGQSFNCQQHIPQQNWLYGTNIIQETSFPVLRQNISTPSPTPTQFSDQSNQPQRQQSMMQGDEWNGDISLESTILLPSDSSNLSSQTMVNIPTVSNTSPELQTMPKDH